MDGCNDVLCIYLYIFTLFYVLLFEIKMSTLPLYHCYTTIYSHYSIQLSPWLSPCHFHNNYFVFNAQVELQTFLSLPTTPLQSNPAHPSYSEIIIWIYWQSHRVRLGERERDPRLVIISKLALTPD